MQLLEHFKELSLRPKNAKELKGLILQLAIQGKLTSKWRKENPDIELASDLLNRIQKEKEQLIKEKKIRNEKPYPKIDKEILAKKVPLSWGFNYIRDISSVVTCGMASTPKYTETGRMFLSAKNVKPFTFKPEKHRFVSEETYQKIIKNSKPEKGDLLLTRVGAGIGEACVIDQDIDFAFYVSLTLIKPMEGIDAYYMLYWLSSKDGITKVLDNIYGKGVSQGNLNVNQVRQFVIPVPPLEEQKEIVKVVEILFKEVEQLEQLTVARIGLKEDFVTSALNQLTTNNANQEWAYLQEHFKSFFNETTNIKKLREAVLQLAVQGKLTADWRQQQSQSGAEVEDASKLLKRIQEEKAQLIADKKIKKEKPLPSIAKDEIPYDLPEGWVWCRLGDYAHYGALFKCENKDASSNTWVLELEDIEKGSSELLKKVRFSERDFKSTKSVFKSSDVIYGKLRPYLDKVIVADEDGICTTEMIPIKLFGSSNPEYLRWYLKHPDFIDYANSSTHGMRMPRMGTDVAKKALISIPPLREQKAIVEKVNVLMGLCDALVQEVQQSQAHSEQLMQSVLREVFEGKMEVCV